MPWRCATSCAIAPKSALQTLYKIHHRHGPRNFRRVARIRKLPYVIRNMQSRLMRATRKYGTGNASCCLHLLSNRQYHRWIPMCQCPSIRQCHYFQFPMMNHHQWCRTCFRSNRYRWTGPFRSGWDRCWNYQMTIHCFRTWNHWWYCLTCHWKWASRWNRWWSCRCHPWWFHHSNPWNRTWASAQEPAHYRIRNRQCFHAKAQPSHAPRYAPRYPFPDRR